MNATEALKEARELLEGVQQTYCNCLCAEDGPEDGPESRHTKRCDALRAFLALPSPVEEGEHCPGCHDHPACESVGRDTSKPEEKRYAVAELELAFDAMVEARTGLDFYETDGSAWDAFRAALTGEKP